MEGQGENKQETVVVEEQKGEKAEKGYYKKKKEEKKEKAEKVQSQYQYNAQEITQSTVIAPLPKKNELIPKPELQDYKQRELKIKEKIYKLNDKKKQIRASKFERKTKIVKGQQTSYDLFKMQLDDVKEARERMVEVKKKRNQLRDKLTIKIEQAKENNAILKTINASFKGTRESMYERLRELQHRLTTAELTKDEEKNLNNQIMVARREINQAESSQNLQLKLQKAEARKEELDEEIKRIKEEKEPYEQTYNELKLQLDGKSSEIDKLKGNIDSQNTEKTKAREEHEKQYQEWLEDKRKKLLEFDEKITKLEEESDKLWEQFEKKKDEYWKQKQYIDFINWQTKVKERKAQDRIRQEKRKMYEQLDKAREEQQKKQKYIKQIELCNFLINYLNNIRNVEEKQQNGNNQKKQPVDVQAKIAQDSQWKGVQLLKPKKTKQDEEPIKKKNKKDKKKNEQKKQQKFEIPYNVQAMFDSIKVLVPNNPEDIQRAIKDLNQREQLFNRACKEEVDEKDKEAITALNGKNKNTSKKTKVQEEDFPQM